MSDEKIIEALEKFGLLVGNKRIYENELENGYNYFVFRRGILTESSCNMFVRKINISYIYQGEQKISDFEIINKIKNLGLNFKEMEADDFQLASTNDWVDMNTYVFERPERG